MKLTVSNMDMNGGVFAKKSRSSATNFENMEIHTTNMEKAATNGSAMDMNGINWKTNVQNTDMEKAATNGSAMDMNGINWTTNVKNTDINTNKLEMNATNGNYHTLNIQINLFTPAFTPT